MQKTKLINFRVIFYSFIAFCLGIIFARQIINLDIFCCIFLSLLFASILAVCIYFKCIKRFFILFLALCVGFGWYFLGVKKFEGKNYGDIVYTISARVNFADNEGNGQTYILSNVIMNGKKESCKLYLRVTYPMKLANVGDVLTFESKIEAINLYSLTEISTYYYKNNISHRVNAKFNDIDVSKGGLTLTEKLKENTKDILKRYMSEDSAEFAYSSLFNDKTSLSDDIKDSFRLSGISHMIATSGLHVGFIVALFSFVLKKLKGRRWLKTTLYLVILVFYAYICGFSSSITRAVIMFGVLGISNALGVKKDNLTTLAVAGYIILIFKPLYIFDAGFLLSFFSVFFIYLWQRPIEKFLLKLKFPKKVASLLAVTIGVQTGLLVIMAMFYEEFSFLSIITNLITVPLFEIGFMLVAVFSIIVAIFPFLGAVMFVPDLIFHFILSVSNVISGLSFAVVPLFKITIYTCIGIYASIFIFSKFVMIKPKHKIIVSCVILSVCVCISLLSLIPVKIGDNQFIIFDTYSNSYAIEYKNESYLISDTNYQSDIVKLQKYLINHKKYQFNYVIALNDTIAEYFDEYAKNIVVFNNNETTEQKQSIKNIKEKIFKSNLIVLNYNQTQIVGDLEIDLLNNSQKEYGLFIKNLSAYISLSDSLNNAEKINLNNNYVNDISIYFGNDEFFALNNQNIALAIINKSKIYENNILQKSSKGNWTFSLNCDKIEEIKSLD